ncbi:sodium bile acid symporter family-domain-containing protein [Gymnopilus junonius]|uniref:Sodium bile acid symporter family-domain-containing protein n=1 Tax=Gymnopilus junonius TaxID=109634 RepID=A0A9P5NYY5_GYMJU|nr:sodium bile acid symporter family-domain-containing protein [Gymnopilus junonius]
MEGEKYSEKRDTRSTDEPTPVMDREHETLAPSGKLYRARLLFKKLGILDRLLSPLIILFMIIGVIIGEFAPSIQQAFDTVRFHSVSVPIAIGLIVMMWPVLTKVQYETLPQVFSTSRIWIHIGISMLLNWIMGPLIMLGLAWATLPDLPTYRTGVILVGLARCIAMVMIWNELARGSADYCAILVVINSILQIILYSPYALLFINTIGGQHRTDIHVSYGNVAISVLIYLGIPLVAGVITRYSIWYFLGKEFLNKHFIPYFSPLALLGLLYTILVITSSNLRPVFRVFVPMILYFLIMWTSAFALIYYLTRRKNGQGKKFGYQMAVVQSFTAGSNNFELAIAVAIAVYGVSSDQALAATIGPLVEVPVLLSLTWVALFLGRRLNWSIVEDHVGKDSSV